MDSKDSGDSRDPRHSKDSMDFTNEVVSKLNSEAPKKK